MKSFFYIPFLFFLAANLNASEGQKNAQSTAMAFQQGKLSEDDLYNVTMIYDNGKTYACYQNCQQFFQNGLPSNRVASGKKKANGSIEPPSFEEMVKATIKGAANYMSGDGGKNILNKFRRNMAVDLIFTKAKGIADIGGNFRALGNYSASSVNGTQAAENQAKMSEAMNKTK